MLSKQTGFTLIELLISVTLLSLLMLLGTFSYSVYTNKWQNELGQFSQVNSQATNFQRLHTILKNISPLVVRKNNGQPGFFLVGTKTSLIAVTHDALFAHDSSEVFRFTISKNQQQKFELLYQAMPLENSTIVAADQEVLFTDNIVLLEDFDEISLTYLGWPHFSDQDPTARSSNITAPLWTSTYSALDSQIMPEKIAVYLKKGPREITFLIDLSLNAARWMSPYWDELEQ